MRIATIKMLFLLSAVFAAGSVAARGGEDIMAMIPGPYAYVAPREEPAAAGQGAGLDRGDFLGLHPNDEPARAARPELRKNIIKLTLPSASSRAALAEELAEFVPVAAMPRSAAAFDAPAARASLTEIPGLVTPETLAMQPQRDFHEDVRDLVSLDDAPAAPAFERFDSAGYTVPISTPTYIAPAPEEFVLPSDSLAMASESLPRPNEVLLPAPLFEAGMPPLPYLDPLAGPRSPVDGFSSKTEALIPIPSMGATRTPTAPLADFAPSAPVSTVPAYPLIERYDSHAPASVAMDETLNLAGPLLAIRTPDDAPPPRAKRTVREQRDYEKPAVIGGVPALSPGQFRGRSKPVEAAESPAVEDNAKEPAKGFDPLRPIKSLFGGKSK